MKTTIARHASVLLVHHNDTLFTNQYDKTYPLEAYRERINLLGGTPQPSDRGPHDTLIRELTEEFTRETRHDAEFDKTLVSTLGTGPAAPKVTSFAPENDIRQVREYILQTLKPCADVLIGVPSYGSRPSYKVLFHVYTAPLSKEIFDIVQRNLSQGKSFVSEGFLRLTSLNDIRRGSLGTAWATGPVIEHCFKTSVPNPDGITSEIRGQPRLQYTDYDVDFTLKKI